MTQQTVTINGQSYRIADLSDTAKTLLGNIKVADRKLADLQQEIALVTVARDTYGKALLANLPGQAPAPPDPPPASVTLN